MSDTLAKIRSICDDTSLAAKHAANLPKDQVILGIGMVYALALDSIDQILREQGHNPSIPDSFILDGDKSKLN